MKQAQVFTVTRHRRQEGVVLIVGLIMVLLMSIVAMAAIRSSGLQEAMAGNMRNRNLAFQAAESALSAGEALVDVELVPVAPVFDGTSGRFQDRTATPANSVNYLTYDTIKVNTMGVVTNFNLKNVFAQPAYIAEELPSFSPKDGSCLDASGCLDLTKLTPYRITAIGVGISEESQVMLQSTYNRIAQ